MEALCYPHVLRTVLRHADDLDTVDVLFNLVSLALHLQTKTSKTCVLVHPPQSDHQRHNVQNRAETFKHLAMGIPMGLA
eukprot:1714941-Amphidinium_carterae.2